MVSSLVLGSLSAKLSRLGFAWGLIAIVVVIDGIWLSLGRLDFKQHALSTLLPFGLAIAVLMPFVRANPLTRVLHGYLFLIVAWPALRLFNHLTFSISGAWYDEAFARLDDAFGLSWLAYARWLNEQPVLLQFLEITYGSLTPFSMASFIAVALLGTKRAAEEFLLLFAILAVIVSILGIALPAYGPTIYFETAVASLEHVHGFGRMHLPFYEALRSGTPQTLTLEALPGLTTFPSFHTAMGLILVYCARERWFLLWPAAFYSGVMIAGTPIFGSHYFVDILAGALATALAIAAIRAVWPHAGEHPDYLLRKFGLADRELSKLIGPDPRSSSR